MNSAINGAQLPKNNQQSKPRHRKTPSVVQKSEFPFLPDESEDTSAKQTVTDQKELEKLFSKDKSPSPGSSANKKGEDFQTLSEFTNVNLAGYKEEQKVKVEALEATGTFSPQDSPVNLTNEEN